MNGIGILASTPFAYNARFAYIDHLVPLCQILEIPILVTDRWFKELIELYYPPMEVILAEADDFCLDEALKDYDTFVYVDPFRKPQGSFHFGDYFTKKRARSVYAMHGNSDKKKKVFWIEQLADEDVILLYGQHASDFMHEKGVYKPYIRSGNYRLQYYLKNETFFDSKLPRLDDKINVLYAPTWSSPNLKSDWRFDYSSFFDLHRYVFEEIPDNFQLIVKLHSIHNVLMRDEVQKVKETYPHIFFLDDFPLIYPLLKKTSVYLGDFSSIGYDFLYFQRPMFFLHLGEPTYLHQCGITLESNQFEQLYSIIQQNLSNARFMQKQKEIYFYAFGEKKELAELGEEIKNACR